MDCFCQQAKKAKPTLATTISEPENEESCTECQSKYHLACIETIFGPKPEDSSKLVCHLCKTAKMSLSLRTLKDLSLPEVVDQNSVRKMEIYYDGFDPSKSKRNEDSGEKAGRSKRKRAVKPGDIGLNFQVRVYLLPRKWRFDSGDLSEIKSLKDSLIGEEHGQKAKIPKFHLRIYDQFGSQFMSNFGNLLLWKENIRQEQSQQNFMENQDDREIKAMKQGTLTVSLSKKDSKDFEIPSKNDASMVLIVVAQMQMRPKFCLEYLLFWKVCRDVHSKKTNFGGVTNPTLEMELNSMSEEDKVFTLIKKIADQWGLSQVINFSKPSNSSKNSQLGKFRKFSFREIMYIHTILFKWLKYIDFKRVCKFKNSDHFRSKWGNNGGAKPSEFQIRVMADLLKILKKIEPQIRDFSKNFKFLNNRPGTNEMIRVPYECLKCENFAPKCLNKFLERENSRSDCCGLFLEKQDLKIRMEILDCLHKMHLMDLRILKVICNRNKGHSAVRHYDQETLFSGVNAMVQLPTKKGYRIYLNRDYIEKYQKSEIY